MIKRFTKQCSDFHFHYAPLEEVSARCCPCLSGRNEERVAVLGQGNARDGLWLAGTFPRGSQSFWPTFHVVIREINFCCGTGPCVPTGAIKIF